MTTTTKRAKVAGASLDAKAKGRQTVVLRELDGIAREVNARWDQAQKLDAKADDHRLAAALFLAQAREKCVAAKINFRQWCEAHISLAYETARKLVTIGQAPEPKVALIEYRARQARHQANTRARQAAAAAGQVKPGAKLSRASQGHVVAERPAPVLSAIEAIKAASDTARRSAAETLAGSVGMAVMPKDKADRLRAFDADPKDAIVRAFQLLVAGERRMVLERLAGMCDARVIFTTVRGGQSIVEDNLAIPEFLDRRGTKKMRRAVAASAAAAE